MTTTEQRAQPVMMLSDAASTKVAQLLSDMDEEGLALRVAVRAGGCSGLSYEMFFDTESRSDDHEVTFGSVTVRVDAESAPHLTGATLNYSDGLQGEGFSVDNPNAQRSCGCGKSFG
ncbi:HesB/IscA family protein [Rhabdothermincola salaria]|uniref:HesB/IscA family protein n=1 Tax=Rhabdothermincola salaria TaxID=2903142 RepID=UPI001E5C1E7B|nr:iron-sulfur cluster assembly accessory protein [Rhabdothermincola salaria]MCD9622827.1 iron-sulfur cluster assembly accessory protein [Rhabdothermincola salaria]